MAGSVYRCGFSALGATSRTCSWRRSPATPGGSFVDTCVGEPKAGPLARRVFGCDRCRFGVLSAHGNPWQGAGETRIRRTCGSFILNSRGVDPNRRRGRCLRHQPRHRRRVAGSLGARRTTRRGLYFWQRDPRKSFGDLGQGLVVAVGVAIAIQAVQHDVAERDQLAQKQRDRASSLLTVEEVAALFSVTPRTVYNWASRRRRLRASPLYRCRVGDVSPAAAPRAHGRVPSVLRGWRPRPRGDFRRGAASTRNVAVERAGVAAGLRRRIDRA
jgi:hypothetical protein